MGRRGHARAPLPVSRVVIDGFGYPVAVDMLIGHMQEFMLSPVRERGFPVSNNGNG
jgi:hypothetical protein